MSQRTITLPAKLMDYVNDAVERGGYASAEAYLRDLIDADRRARARTRLEAGLLESQRQIDRGEGEELTPDFWRQMKAEVRKRGRRPRVK